MLPLLFFFLEQIYNSLKECQESITQVMKENKMDHHWPKDKNKRKWDETIKFNEFWKEIEELKLSTQWKPLLFSIDISPMFFFLYQNLHKFIVASIKMQNKHNEKERKENSRRNHIHWINKLTCKTNNHLLLTFQS